MGHQFAIAAGTITGLIIAQALFTLFVRDSNLNLYAGLAALKQDGYTLLVPNDQVAPTLLAWKNAGFGALFFTLTIGAGLSFLGVVFAPMLRRVSTSRRARLLVWVLGCGFCGWVLWRLNDRGFNPQVSLIFLVIPVAAGLAAIRCLPPTPPAMRRRWLLLHPLVLGLTAAAWIPVMNADVFTDIRDHLLLTHPVGRAINDFYYRHTLYPAEAFKSLDQKLIKPIIPQQPTSSLKPVLARALAAEDYLPTSRFPGPHLTITHQDETLVFRISGREVHQSSVSAFLKDPEGCLDEVSKNSDRQHFFRKLTFLSLIIASPLLCYLLIHGLMTLILAPLFSPRMRAILAAAGCLALGVASALPLYNDLIYKDEKNPISPSELERHLSSRHWRDRVMALKYLADARIPLDRYPAIPPKLTDSPWVAERYWLAKAAGNSRSSLSSEIIRTLMKDPHPNVVCMAIHSMGRRGLPRDREALMGIITTSPHWYVQWYAYKALKRVGWRQEPQWKGDAALP